MKNRKYIFLKILILICFGLSLNPTIAQTNNLKVPQKFIQNIIEKIKNKEKWENKFIEIVQNKFKIINGGINIFYKYDRKPSSLRDTIIYVAFKSSNLPVLLNIENKLSQELTYECYNNVSIQNLFDSLETSRHIEIGFFPDINFDTIVQIINNIIGNPIQNEIDKVTWNKNDYRISVIKSFSKPILEIDFKENNGEAENQIE